MQGLKKVGMEHLSRRQQLRAKTQESSNRLFSLRSALRPPTAPLMRRGNLAAHDHVWWREYHSTDLSSRQSQVPVTPLAPRESSTRLALGASTTIVRYSSFETHLIARRAKDLHAKAHRMRSVPLIHNDSAAKNNFAFDRPELLPVFYPQLLNVTSASSTVRSEFDKSIFSKILTYFVNRGQSS